ncbi:MAG: type II secretion system protein [Puniceicoccaceae bacterium]|nr:MAG: type II secretion system protein [Puniceicoccaceae bacterium]
MLAENLKTKKSRGFTLTEIMFVSAILGLVSIVLVGFIRQTGESMNWATNKTLVVRDVRNFTTRITNEAFAANIGVVYSGFALNERNEVGKRLESGQSGDCLVLVHRAPLPQLGDPMHYTKLVIYFRQPDSDGVSPVYRAEVEFTTPQPTASITLEALLASNFPTIPTNAPVVLELSRGLASGNLFHNLGGSFLINGEILHGKKAREVTNTYNLTISTRG